jgi:hypothetical protein
MEPHELHRCLTSIAERTEAYRIADDIRALETERLSRLRDENEARRTAAYAALVRDTRYHRSLLLAYYRADPPVRGRTMDLGLAKVRARTTPPSIEWGDMARLIEVLPQFAETRTTTVFDRVAARQGLVVATDQVIVGETGEIIPADVARPIPPRETYTLDVGAMEFDLADCMDPEASHWYGDGTMGADIDVAHMRAIGAAMQETLEGRLMGEESDNADNGSAPA